MRVPFTGCRRTGTSTPCCHSPRRPSGPVTRRSSPRCRSVPHVERHGLAGAAGRCHHEEGGNGSATPWIEYFLTMAERRAHDLVPTRRRMAARSGGVGGDRARRSGRGRGCRRAPSRPRTRADATDPHLGRLRPNRRSAPSAMGRIRWRHAARRDLPRRLPALPAAGGGADLAAHPTDPPGARPTRRGRTTARHPDGTASRTHGPPDARHRLPRCAGRVRGRPRWAATAADRPRRHNRTRNRS